MLCFLILAVAVHGVPKNIQDFVYFFDNNIFIYSISKCNPKLMSFGQVKIIIIIFSPFETLIGKLDSENIEYFLMGDLKVAEHSFGSL